MSPGAVGLVTFLAVYSLLLLSVFLVTRRDREGMPSGAHPWIAGIAAVAAVLVAIEMASPTL